MQINRNHRKDKTFFQLMSNAYLNIIVILLCGFLVSCTQLKPNVKNTTNTILPVADSRDLPDVIQSLIQQSDLQYSNQNLAGALATLERAVHINPRHAEVWSRMAKIYLQQGKVEQAKQHAKRSNSVIKNNPPLKKFNDNIITPNSMEPLN